MNHQIITHDVEPPTSLDMLIGMVSKTANEDGFGWVQSISIRMPMHLACTVDALAQHSGQSRNKLMVKCMEVALDALWQELPQSEREAIEAVRGQLLGQKLKDKDGESGEV